MLAQTMRRGVKNKFLISNDVGVALDKVNSVISVFRSENLQQSICMSLMKC